MDSVGNVLGSVAHRRVVLGGDGHPYRIDVAATNEDMSSMYVIDDQQKFRDVKQRSLKPRPLQI